MSAIGTAKSLAIICNPQATKTEVAVAFAYLRSEIVLLRAFARGQ